LEIHSKDPSEESEREEDSGDEGEVDLRVTDKQRQTQRDKERGREGESPEIERVEVQDSPKSSHSSLRSHCSWLGRGQGEENERRSQTRLHGLDIVELSI
jgi:hypothetical protein